MTDSVQHVLLGHMELVYRVGVALTGSAADADDLLQDTYARALRKIGQVRDTAAARAWLLTIQRRIFVDHYRARAARPELVLSDDDAAVALETLGAAGEAEQWLDAALPDEVERALARLPVDARETVWLCDVEGFSYEEAAAVQECAVGTVKSRLHRARAHLARGLGAYARKVREAP